MYFHKAVTEDRFFAGPSKFQNPDLWFVFITPDILRSQHCEVRVSQFKSQNTSRSQRKMLVSLAILQSLAFTIHRMFNNISSLIQISYPVNRKSELRQENKAITFKATEYKQIQNTFLFFVLFCNEYKIKM